METEQTQPEEPTAQAPEGASVMDSADEPDPALASVLQEADKPDTSLISEMTKALKPGQHRQSSISAKDS
jgi:hypothetical protein